MPDVGGVVHTIGTLLEDWSYKEKLRKVDVGGLLRSLTEGSGNPLDEKARRRSYEVMNRDTGNCYLRAQRMTMKSFSFAGVRNLPVLKQQHFHCYPSVRLYFRRGYCQAGHIGSIYNN